MTRENAKDYLPLVKAMAEGKSIQMKKLKADGWIDFHADENISFDLPADQYRIKPEPRVIWVNEYTDGCLYLHSSEGEAKIHTRNTDYKRTLKFVEVVE